FAVACKRLTVDADLGKFNNAFKTDFGVAGAAQYHRVAYPDMRRGVLLLVGPHRASGRYILIEPDRDFGRAVIAERVDLCGKDFTPFVSLLATLDFCDVAVFYGKNDGVGETTHRMCRQIEYDGAVAGAFDGANVSFAVGKSTT